MKTIQILQQVKNQEMKKYIQIELDTYRICECYHNLDIIWYSMHNVNPINFVFLKIIVLLMSTRDICCVLCHVFKIFWDKRKEQSKACHNRLGCYRSCITVPFTFSSCICNRVTSSALSCYFIHTIEVKCLNWIML